jgi:SulP family sulfate permease
LLVVPRADAVVFNTGAFNYHFWKFDSSCRYWLAFSLFIIYERASDLGEEGLKVGTLAGFDGEKPWQDEIEFYEAHKDKVYIKHLYGPLFLDLPHIFKMR